MPVIGIDLGSQNCVVSVARKGGIDIVTNEYSRRYTPSYVTFADNERLIGESGMVAQQKYHKRTISLLKRFIGLKYSQLPQDVLQANISVPIVKGSNDEILFKIEGYKLNDNDNEAKLLTPVQLLGMFFGKLLNDVESAVGVRESDCVITVPCYFNEVQRRAIYQAAEIAGLNVIRIMNDVTAAALGYGIYKDFTDEPQYIAFVDVGHCDSSVYIVEFKKSQLKVVSCASDPNLGAIALEKALFDYYVQEIKNKYKMDVTTNPVATIRLQRECEKLKKFLSANPVSNLRIECLMNDKDVSFQMKRDEFLNIVQPVLTGLESPVKQALEAAQIKPEQLATVELLGGGSYIPAIREALTKIFGREVQSTLNATESTAKGAAIQAAMISPKFTLAREFNVLDAIYHPINLGWIPEGNDDKMEDDISDDSLVQSLKQSLMYKKFEATPSSKMLTFSKAKPFDLYALYADPSTIIPGTSTIMSKFTISNIPPRNEPSKVKVKVRHNLLGLIEVQEAHINEEIEKEVEEPIPEEELKKEQQTTQEQDKMDTTEEQQTEKKEENKPKTRKVMKKETVKHALTVKGTAPQYPPETIKQYIQIETIMRNHDIEVHETGEAKNAVESYCYQTKDRVLECGDLYEYVDDQSRDSFVTLLDDTESWLYGEGENCTKTVYQQKLAELKKIGDKFETRLKEAELRPEAIKGLEESIKEYQTFLSNMNSEQYSHITDEEKQKVKDKVEESVNWLNGQLEQQSKLAKHQDPVLTAIFLENRKKDLKKVCGPIVSKPKPKEEKKEQPQNTQQPTEEKKEEKKEEKMDETA
ncbi:hypothetical protein ABK040_009133 [Willaertia magna]